MKLIRAELNPLKDLDLAEALPCFSQGAEKALNLTEKVNQAISNKMEEKRKRELEGKPNSRLPVQVLTASVLAQARTQTGQKNSKTKKQQPGKETCAPNDQSINKPSEKKTEPLQAGAKSDSSPPKPEHVNQQARPSRGKTKTGLQKTPTENEETNLAGTQTGKTNSLRMVNDMHPWTIETSGNSYPTATSIKRQTSKGQNWSLGSCRLS